MLRRRTDGHRLVFGMRKKIQAPAHGTDKPDHHSDNGEDKMRDKAREKKRQSEGGHDWPSRGRRELDGILRLGMIVLHGQ